MQFVQVLYSIIWPRCKELIHWKRPWCWERLNAGEKGDDRGWNSWMASLTRWTWVWESSRSWWWIGKPGVLRSLGSQRVRHDWANELNWTELNNPRISDSGITYLTLRICYDSEALIASKKWKDFKLPDFSMVNFTSQSIYIFFLLCHSRQLTGGINLPDFRLYYKATVIKTV